MGLLFSFFFFSLFFSNASATVLLGMNNKTVSQGNIIEIPVFLTLDNYSTNVSGIVFDIKFDNENLNFLSIERENAIQLWDENHHKVDDTIRIALVSIENPLISDLSESIVILRFQTNTIGHFNVEIVNSSISDENGNVNSNITTQNMALTITSSSFYELSIDDRINDESDIVIPVLFHNHNKSIAGIVFSFYYNSNIIQFRDITSGVLTNNWDLYYNRLNNNALRIVVVNSINAIEPLVFSSIVNLRFGVIGNNYDTSILNLGDIQISDCNGNIIEDKLIMIKNGSLTISVPVSESTSQPYYSSGGGSNDGSSNSNFNDNDLYSTRTPSPIVTKPIVSSSPVILPVSNPTQTPILIEEEPFQWKFIAIPIGIIIAIVLFLVRRGREYDDEEEEYIDEEYSY